MEFFKARTKASQCSSSFVTSVPPAKRRCEDKHIGPSDISQSREDRPTRGSCLSYPRDGTKRRVQPQWFKEYDWLEYSATLNTLFCHTCRFYSHRDAVRSAFASENGFGNFNDGPSRLKPHQNSKRHQNATNSMIEYLRMKETDTSCAFLLSEQHKKFVEENRHYIGGSLEVCPILFSTRYRTSRS